MSDHPQEVVFTARELEYLRFRAHQHLTQTPTSVCLPGTNTAVTESEFIALAWLRASAEVLGQKKCGTYITPMLDNPSSEPDTDDL